MANPTLPFPLPPALNESYHYVFSTTPIFSGQIVNGLSANLYFLFLNIIEALGGLLTSLVYILLIVAKLCTLGAPHVIAGCQTVLEFHRQQLGWFDLLIEFSVFLILILYFIFRRKILAMWRRLEKGLEKRSKAAAKAAPHILFFGSALLFVIVGKKIVRPLATSTGSPIFTLVIPIISTMRVAGACTSIDNNYGFYRQMVCLWIILGAYHSIATILGLIPFSSSLLSILPYVREFIAVTIAWSQLSATFTDIVFEAASPMLKGVASNIPVVNLGDNSTTFSGFLVSLKLMRIIGERQEILIKAILQDSAAFFLTLFFLFTPMPFARIGEVILSFVLPLFRSAATLTGTAAHGVDTKSNMNANIKADKWPASHTKGRSMLDKTDTTNGSASVSGSVSGKVETGVTFESSFLTPPHVRSAFNAIATPSVRMAEYSSLSASEILCTQERKRWLEYWIVMGCMWLLRLYWFKLWPSVAMLISLWLQHTYFQGASWILNIITLTIQSEASRNKMIKASIKPLVAKSSFDNSITPPPNERCSSNSSSNNANNRDFGDEEIREKISGNSDDGMMDLRDRTAKENNNEGENDGETDKDSQNISRRRKHK